MSTDIENTLRASLAEHVRHAPDGAMLAERIIAAAPRTRPVRPARSWRTWALPLVAAGSVAAVVGAVVGVGAHRPSAEQRVPVGGSNSVVAPAPSAAPTSIRTPDLSAAPSGGVSVGPPTAAPTAPPRPPSGFRVADLTFVSGNEGWALGTGQCYRDPSARCTAMLHTTDGGTSWQSVTNPPANVFALGSTCTQPCVRGLRFADEKVGYAYGPSALFMTTDGGTTWAKASGGAAALEITDGIALRVTPGPDGCDCDVLLRSAVGSREWTTQQLPRGGLRLAYVGSVPGLSILVALTSPSHARLLVSADDGVTWADRGPLCGGVIDVVDVINAAVGVDRSVTVECAGYQGGKSYDFLVTSTDAGRSFGPPRTVPGSGSFSSALAAPTAGTLVVAQVEGAQRPALLRSVDGGASWSPVPSAAERSSEIGGSTDFLGFESDRVGRWVPASGTTIWTTTDAGATWTPHTFA